jgi:hypothetical protein
VRQGGIRRLGVEAVGKSPLAHQHGNPHNQSCIIEKIEHDNENDLLSIRNIITVSQRRITQYSLLTLKQKMLSSNMLNQTTTHRKAFEAFIEPFINNVEQISVHPPSLGGKIKGDCL